MSHIVSADVQMLDPHVNPPPRGRKVLLVTVGGVQTVGHWSDDCVAWHPLLKVPSSVKARQKAKFREYKS